VGRDRGGHVVMGVRGEDEALPAQCEQDNRRDDKPLRQSEGCRAAATGPEGDYSGRPIAIGQARSRAWPREPTHVSKDPKVSTSPMLRQAH
jgi:hypothetical protein